MADSNAYTGLIAGAHFGHPKFTQFIYELTQPFVTAQERLASLATNDFDLDYAIGKQLDAVGVRVGISRELPIKISDAYFALDDVDGIGLDLGIWWTEADPIDGFVSLSDGAYRMLLKAKIACNQFDGRNASMPDYLDAVMSPWGLSQSDYTIKDNGDMSMTLSYDKSSASVVLWEILSRRLIDICPAGVTLNLVDTGVS